MSLVSHPNLPIPFAFAASGLPKKRLRSGEGWIRFFFVNLEYLFYVGELNIHIAVSKAPRLFSWFSACKIHCVQVCNHFSVSWQPKWDGLRILSPTSRFVDTTGFKSDTAVVRFELPIVNCHSTCLWRWRKLMFNHARNQGQNGRVANQENVYKSVHGTSEMDWNGT